jgi:hypothetical protein
MKGAMDRIRWGRIVLAAVLLEAAITVLVIPFGLLFGNPMSPPADGRTVNTLPYLLAAAAGCAGFGFLFGRWAARESAARAPLHGLLTGIVATVLYIGGMSSLAPGGIAAVVTAYGAGWYVLFNVIRVLGCWLGGASQGRRAA